MKIRNLTKTIAPTLTKVGGGIAGSYLQKFIPFGNEKAKAGSVLLLGMLFSGQKGIVGQLAEGAAIVAGVKLANTFGIGGGDFINGIDDAAFINGLEDLTGGGMINGSGNPYNYNEVY